MIFQPLSSSSMADRSPEQIGRTFSDCQVQPFHVGRVQFSGIFGITPRLIPSPGCSNSDPSLHFYNAIIPAFLDHLAKETRCFEDSLDHSPIKPEAVTRNQRNAVALHAIGNITKQIERVAVTALPHDGGGPQTRPNFDGDEDPNGRLLLAANERPNLISLQFSHWHMCNPQTIEPTAEIGGSFQPPIYSVPTDLLGLGRWQICSRPPR